MRALASVIHMLIRKRESSYCSICMTAPILPSRPLHVAEKAPTDRTSKRNRSPLLLTYVRVFRTSTSLDSKFYGIVRFFYCAIERTPAGTKCAHDRHSPTCDTACLAPALCMAADIFTVDLMNDQHVSVSMRHACARERKIIGTGGKAMCMRRNDSVGINTLSMHVSMQGSA
jgi:hypothetical protein